MLHCRELVVSGPSTSIGNGDDDDDARDGSRDATEPQLHLEWPLPRPFRLVLGQLGLQPNEERRPTIYAKHRDPRRAWRANQAHRRHVPKGPFQMKEGDDEERPARSDALREAQR
jgi:hypothetical protein